MGTDIHCVLQKQDTDTDKWETVLYDVFPGRDYMLNAYLKDRWANDLPDDFRVSSNGNLDNVHNGFWMGAYGFGHCTVEEFVKTEDPFPAPEFKDNYSVRHETHGITIDFEEPYDECESLRKVKEMLPYLLGPSTTYIWNGIEHKDGIQLYRLVWGFDS